MMQQNRTANESSGKKTLVVASRNQGKIKEFEAMLAPLGFEVKGLNSFPQIPDIVEDGATFEANALKKASEVAHFLHIPVLADDSGLCVDLLQGAPGVYSARYAGEDATDQQNNEKLVQALQEKSNNDSDSRASVGLSRGRFVCVLAFVDPIHSLQLTAEGVCEGEILSEPRGSGGFGYDPLFYLPTYQRTMSELTLEEKNEISHRAKALRAMVNLLNENLN